MLSFKSANSRSDHLALAVVCGCLCVLGCAREQTKVSPESHISTGWANYRLGEFSLSLKDFESAADQSVPGSVNQLSALYGQATIWCLRRPGEDLEKAEKLYRQVIELAPTNSQAAWCWLSLARIKAMPIGGEAPDLTQLVQAYQAVIDRFPFHSAGEEAFLFQQAAKLGTPDEAGTREALVALQDFLKTHPQSPWRSEAYALIAHCCLVLGLEDQRLDVVLQAWKPVEIGANNSLQDLSWTYWKIATTAEFDAGDFAMAREYYHKLISDYPSEQKVFLAKQELRRMDELEARLRVEESQ